VGKLATYGFRNRKPGSAKKGSENRIENHQGHNMEAPEHLSVESQRFWLGVTANFDVEPPDVLILTQACELWDTKERARKVLETEGLTYVDRFGAPRPRPEHKIAHDSKLAFLKCLSALGLHRIPMTRAAETLPKINVDD
jgi:phage terminase small subunit